jgi:hypothetical protein
MFAMPPRRAKQVGRRGHTALDPMHGADTEAMFLGGGAGHGGAVVVKVQTVYARTQFICSRNRTMV